MTDPVRSLCTLCGEPMPAGEEMFKFQGYSGPCPAPPLPKQTVKWKMVPTEPTEADVERVALRLANCDDRDEVWGVDRIEACVAIRAFLEGK